jgi:hypothetical protein
LVFRAVLVRLALLRRALPERLATARFDFAGRRAGLAFFFATFRIVVLSLFSQGSFSAHYESQLLRLMKVWDKS